MASSSSRATSVSWEDDLHPGFTTSSTVPAPAPVPAPLNLTSIRKRSYHQTDINSSRNHNSMHDSMQQTDTGMQDMPRSPRAAMPGIPTSQRHHSRQISPHSLPSSPRTSRALSVPYFMRPRTTATSHAEPRPVSLSFWQKYFTKPIGNSKDSEHTEKQSPSRRKFAFTSVGFIVTTVLLSAMLIALMVALGVVFAHGRPSSNANTGEESSGPNSPVRMVISANFPDPEILYHPRTSLWYAYATTNAAGILSRPKDTRARLNAALANGTKAANVQIASSPDFVTWTVLPNSQDPLPQTGLWAHQDNPNQREKHIHRANVWAPAILQRRTDQKYILYYSAGRSKWQNSQRQKNGKRHKPSHCMGAALSSSPLGPFHPLEKPIACPLAAGGAIDPTAFYDKDGSLYLIYKIDGNNAGNGGSCGNMAKPQTPTPLLLQRMQPDGVTKDGEPVKILDRTEDDGPLVEAPEIVRSHEGIYFLFYSSGCTREKSYDVKYATADSIRGPWMRAKMPLLQTGDWGLEAPGSVGIESDGKGGWNMAFHARIYLEEGGVRAMFVTKLKMEGKEVRLERVLGGDELAGSKKEQGGEVEA